MKFLDDKILAEANLVCPFARAELLLNEDDPDREALLQSRTFLMEVFSKVEMIRDKLDTDDEARDHCHLLQTILHYMQGVVSWSLGDTAHADNELKIALTNISDDVAAETVLTSASINTELARLYCQRKHYDEADKYYSKVTALVTRYEQSQSCDPFSLQVSLALKASLKFISSELVHSWNISSDTRWQTMSRQDIIRGH